MRVLQFSIGEADGGRTVEQYLKGSHGFSRRLIIALKKTENGLLRNGVHTRTVDLLTPGDLLEVNLPPETKRMPLCDEAVPILYEDEDVLVYNKPADMPCHQSGGHIYHTLSGVWAAHCAETGAVIPFRAVNRLDKDTTGALVAAKNQLAAGKLWKTVNKVYVAVVRGGLPQEEDIVDLPIRRAAPYEMERIVAPDGQRAVTRYRVLARDPAGDCTLAAFTLLTGRTHQIRVHMAHLGHPLLGDELYGGPREEIPRQALHCAGVAFPQVLSGEPVRVLAELPEDLSALLQRHGMTWDPEQALTLLAEQQDRS